MQTQLNAIQKSRMNVRTLAYCALFAALIGVGAFIRIPLPYIAFSMQGFFVSLAGMLLGGKYGALSVLIYVSIGLLGAPVFTMGGGPSYVLQPSFGFLIGFALQAFVTGKLCFRLKNPTVKQLFLAQLPGVGALYAIGLPYFFLISNMYLNNSLGAGALFVYCFAATLPGDIIKCLLAALLGKRLMKAFRMPPAA